MADAYFKNSVAFSLAVLMMIVMMNWQANALRANMKRVDSNPMSSSQSLRAAVLRSNTRLRKIAASLEALMPMDTNVDAPLHRGNNVGEFLITMAVGTPPLKMVAMLDTGSDLIWTQCKPCNNCYSQPHPIFNPAMSTTYGKIPCNSSLCAALPRKTCSQDCEYLYSYSNVTNTTGILSNETLTMWDTNGNQQSFPGITFGCSYDTPRGDAAFSEADGVFGLGRGSLSFVSQLGSTVGSRFSYCLTSFTDDSPSDTSPILFGSAANLTETIGVQSTPMIENIIRKDLNNLYYVSLKSINVGNQRTSVPDGEFDIGADGSGGFIIDSGSALSYLKPAAFGEVAEAIDKAVNFSRADGSGYGFSLCYHVPQGDAIRGFPDITFVFQGGAEYVVDQKHNFRLVDETAGLACALILEMGESMAAVSPSILGNYQQQNYHILYDNANKMISFVRASCASLAQPAFNQTFDDAQSPKPVNSGARGCSASMVSFQLIVALVVVYISVLGVRL